MDTIFQLKVMDSAKLCAVWIETVKFIWLNYKNMVIDMICEGL